MLKATLANSLLFATCVPGALRWRLATHRVMETQRDLLMAIVRKNAATAFGHEHQFRAVGSIAEYREAVPVRSYADLEPYIERVAAGERSVLTAEPVASFALSSGSTAARKRIPYPRSLLREFRRGIEPWLAGLFLEHPSVLFGKAYWQISPAGTPGGLTSGGIRVGFGEDSEYFGRYRGALVRATLAVPESVASIRDIDDFRRETLRHLASRRDLRFISVWHPSFLMLLLGEPGAKAVWPRLRVISCWTDGEAREAADRLKSLFPKAVIQPKGLIATEAMTSFPWRNKGSALAIRSHFFEFLAPGGTPKLAHEVEKGQTYSVVLTTSGGLYRYRIGDLVEVTGWIGQCPLLRFQGKEDGVVDLVGEKLNPVHVTRAVETVLAQMGIAPQFWMVAPERSANPPCYCLYLQSAQEIPAGLLSDLDAALDENFHYGYARRLGQLAPVTLFPIAVDSEPELEYLRSCARAGRRMGDVKRPRLERNGGWSAVFRRAGDKMSQPPAHSLFADKAID